MTLKKNNIYPPKTAQWILQRILKVDLQEEVLGDLAEKYIEKCRLDSKKSADLSYWWQTINYLRPFALRKSFVGSLNPFFMYYSYFKIAWRSLFKHKLYSFINVTGMTVGMTCFILIALYIQYEMSFDLQFEKSEKIYRVAQEQEGNVFRGSDQFAVTPVPLVPAIRTQIPEVESATTFAMTNSQFWIKGQPVNELGIYADTALFDVFDYPVIEGNIREALKDVQSIILTASIAKKFFGHATAIGQTLKMRDGRTLIVQAVIEDLPTNLHFGFGFVTSIANYRTYESDFTLQRWSNNNYRSYVVLQDGADPQDIATKMIPFGDLAAAELIRHNTSFTPRYFLQPITDIHLHSQINMEMGKNGDIRYLYLAASISFMILMLALINYMNLMTARSSQRCKEVGVRKVLGARRKQLVNQFMLESMLVTGISFLMALLLSKILLPAFNYLLDLKIVFSFNDNQMILLQLVAVALLLGICAGFYPAILSSAVAPAKALKGAWFKRQHQGGILRNTLVVGQFAAAIVLAISSIVIFQQLQFIQSKKLGYDRERIVFIPYSTPKAIEKANILRNELLKDPNINNVTITNTLPLNSSDNGIASKWVEKSTGEPDLHIYRVRADYEYIDVFGMEMLEGRHFSPDFPADSSEAYILNEAAVKALGWNSAVGKSFDEGKVIGVVKDFHFQPFHLAIAPMFITFRNSRNSSYGNIVLKMNVDEMSKSASYIETTLGKILPEVPFNLNHMDVAFNDLYQTEKRFGEAFNIFTLIALFIACLGLFGLVTHSVVLRTKEIGIRKVLGASVVNLVSLISKDFLKLVLISTIIAIPVAWLGMGYWLQNFAYRVELQWWVFGVASIFAITLAFFTVGVQSLRAASADPVDSIKSE